MVKNEPTAYSLTVEEFVLVEKMVAQFGGYDRMRQAVEEAEKFATSQGDDSAVAYKVLGGVPNTVPK